MTQQPAPQTVGPVRQPKAPPAFTKLEEGMRDYHISEYLKNLGFLSKEEIDRDYPVKPFQRPRLQRNDNSSRINRMEEGLNETHNASEFDGFNLATAEALGWKVDKPSKFLVKGNSEYISEALGWYTYVAITLRDEKDKPIVTIIGNYACIDNGKSKPMLWLEATGIRKVKGISDLTNNRFHIENHGKTYTIPTFSKAPVVKDLPKEDQNQASTNSSSPNSEEDLKKSVKSLKSD
ncbi:hypothetical protein GLOIN_2v1813037 [Rhizophagus clarus]|uniref:Uncharacterized protein n=1 Tax=Rhizophagus clarus TaxID=94130 RepID=A0A8H3QUG4_9GLOM|nr:hypothetical protein GLOIN_2v1813037 [Rhizophagus clarus]